MFTMAVRTFEEIWVWLAFFSFKTRRVSLLISFAAPAEFAMIL